VGGDDRETAGATRCARPVRMEFDISAYAERVFLFSCVFCVITDGRAKERRGRPESVEMGKTHKSRYQR